MQHSLHAALLFVWPQDVLSLSHPLTLPRRATTVSGNRDSNAGPSALDGPPRELALPLLVDDDDNFAGPSAPPPPSPRMQLHEMLSFQTLSFGFVFTTLSPTPRPPQF